MGVVRKKRLKNKTFILIDTQGDKNAIYKQKLSSVHDKARKSCNQYVPDKILKQMLHNLVTETAGLGVGLFHR